MSQPAPNDRSAESFAEPPDASPPDAGALDAVLRATFESDDMDQRVTPEEVAALREIARRHGAVPLTYDPVAIDLVEAIILVNYGQLRRPPEVWRATAVRIAAVLCESPTARARLESLWARLLESHASPSANA